jgi:hypothetical protein
MYFKRLLTIIDNSFIGNWVDQKREIIVETDPGRIYVENVRSFFGFPKKAARALCKFAVMEGLLEEWITVDCPNMQCRRSIAEVSFQDELKDEYKCTNCQVNSREPYIHSREEVNITTFYKLSSHAE